MDIKRKITLKEVAKHAKVSVAVAGRALNNYGYVSSEKRMRVISSAQKLNYIPNILARSLKTNKTSTIGIIIGDITADFFTLLVRGVEDISKQNGYNIIINNTDENPLKEKNHLEEMVSLNVEGIILSPTGNNIAQLKQIIRSGIPIVLVDRVIKELNTISITIDNYTAGSDGAKYLIKQGYKRIAIIKGLPNISSIEERAIGCLDTIEASGIPVDQNLIKYGNLNREISRKATLDILQLSNQPDAIFILAETMIIGVLEAIKEKNLKIPEDIGILSSDEPSWASIYNPPLTTLKQPNYSIGTIAAQKLISLIQGKNIINPHTQENIVLKAELITRRSCGELK